MISRKSKIIKELIQKVFSEADKSLMDRRKEWESEAKLFKIPRSININKKDIDGVYTEWVSHKKCDAKGLILHFHGGGYVSGSCTTHRKLAVKLALATNQVVVLVDYRLAPENPYPAGINDCIKVYKWIIKNYTNEKNIALSGDSAGGELVMSTLLSLKQQSVVLPKAGVLMSPWTDLTLSGQSYITRGDIEAQLTKENLQEAADGYLNGVDAKDPIASSIFADLSSMPPLLIQVGDEEILLSDSETLAARAIEQGVDAKIEIWDQMWHVWHGYPVTEADEAIKNIAEFLKR